MDLISVSPHWSMYSLCSVKSPPFLSLGAALTLRTIPRAWEWLVEALIIVLKLYEMDGGLKEVSWGNKAFYSSVALHK